MNQSHPRFVSFFYCTVAVVALMSVSVTALSPTSTPSPAQDSSSEIGIRKESDKNTAARSQASEFALSPLSPLSLSNPLNRLSETFAHSIELLG